MQARRPQPPLSHPPLRGGGVHEIEISPLRPIGVTGDASACADHAHAPLGQMLIDQYRSWAVDACMRVMRARAIACMHAMMCGPTI